MNSPHQTIETVGKETGKNQELNPVVLYHRAVLEQIKAKSAQPEVQDKPKIDKDVERSPEPAVKWELISKKNGETEFVVVPNTTQVDFTTVSTHDAEVKAPWVLNFLNHKVNLQSRVEGFKELYINNYKLSKSHNLMVARFAELKVAFLGYLLSVLGVSSEDLKKLQKEAISSSIYENKILFEENEYNAELLNIIGGPKKALRGQQKMISEIRNQLIVHMQRLGLKDYYTKEMMLEIQLAQCQKIYMKFMEEKMNLKYQLAYLNHN